MECSRFIKKTLEGLPATGRLLLCVSGGADSMALLHACVRGGRDCVVVHCDFHLRDSESERDRRFVEFVCRRLHIRCVTVHFDVPAYMEQHGVSMEMACREMRYAAFRRLMAETECVRIVVAHNSSDNDETMLLNLFRGTGVRGLCGMEADTGEIVRPLLSMTRLEIELFLKHLGVRHITDSSNLTSDFRRNFIRRELLPAIESRWPGVRKALERTRRNLTECNMVCERTLADALPEDKSFLPAADLESYPSASILLHAFLKDYGASPSQIDEMAEGIRPGREWRLKSAVASMSKDGIRLYPVTESSKTHELRYSLERLDLTDSLMGQIKGNTDKYTLYYAGDDTLRFRAPRQGERMSPIGMRGSKLVSDLLHEAGIPHHIRRQYPVLEDNEGRIIWIPGVRRSRYLLADQRLHTCAFMLKTSREEIQQYLAHSIKI